MPGQKVSHKQFVSLPHPSVTIRKNAASPPLPHPPSHDQKGPELTLPGALLVKETRMPEASDSLLLISSIPTGESPRIPRMCFFFFFFSNILGYSLSVAGKDMCHVKNKLPYFIHQVMDIIIIHNGICHCEDFHRS